MTSYDTLVGYELQNVPKFNVQIQDSNSDSKIMKLQIAELVKRLSRISAIS